MARILVVEDEPLIGLLVADWLSELSHTVIGPAPDEAAALSLIAAEKPDAAILDISLSGHDSTQVGAALHARGIPFALATGHAGAQADAYQTKLKLEKPFAFEDIRRILSLLLPAEDMR